MKLSIIRENPAITVKFGRYGSVSANIPNRVVRIDYYADKKPRMFINGVRHTGLCEKAQKIFVCFGKKAKKLNWLQKIS